MPDSAGGFGFGNFDEEDYDDSVDDDEGEVRTTSPFLAQPRRDTCPSS